MAVISLKLPSEVFMRLEQLSERTGQTMVFHMIEAIRDRLDDLEDLYAVEYELDEIRAGRSVTTPLHEVMRRWSIASSII